MIHMELELARTRLPIQEPEHRRGWFFRVDDVARLFWCSPARIRRTIEKNGQSFSPSMCLYDADGLAEQIDLPAVWELLRHMRTRPAAAVSVAFARMLAQQLPGDEFLENFAKGVDR